MGVLFGFPYLLAATSLVAWMPRYSIPARPFSYILAAATLSFVIADGRSGRVRRIFSLPIRRRKRIT